MDASRYSITRLLVDAAERAGESAAILAPAREPLTYRQLAVLIRETVAQLNRLGIGRGDRVAMVLPNGPEMATAFFGVASVATAAPLNPAYQAAEFDFYLNDLNPQALLVEAGQESPAREVALARGIPILELIPKREAEAGRFSLMGASGSSTCRAGFAGANDVALVLHTSGTTSRPKIVPLTQANLCALALSIAATLELGASDRGLNVMPLFHIHGLVAGMLAPLSAGGSVVCTPGFSAPLFFGWLDEFQPTWYSAVPTMHQAVLARAARLAEMVNGSKLRFIRSSSAALPPQVMAELERRFDVPVIEAYGMTEASHQMASNPLPPRIRKPGSVGMAAGPEVAIMDEAGGLLSAGKTGEIVIRGANVTPGYENNPQANQAAFTKGWFRTGDQGRLDEDGYLYITGRLKEIINRGGEKISPREVDEALLDHPAVAQAVTFAMPHATLGEDLVAAVVLHAEASVREQDLRAFAFTRLVPAKVPSRIIIVAEIPKGPTGKLQRIGLHEKLAPLLQAEFTLARTPLEKMLASVWTEVLKIERIGIHDNFFMLGGDSLLASQAVVRIRDRLGVELSVATLFRDPSIAALSTLLTRASPYLDSVLGELECLSDEEAQRLLELEQSAR